jgi:threonine dehydrogenase-like Zn-dependent dehydrogenase
MKALQFERNIARFAAARVASAMVPGKGARVGPLSLVDTDPPALPNHQWQRIRPRLAGICGSDLSTIDATASRYFEPIVSFPFVPGHEVVADTMPRPGGGTERVVLEPVLGCVARGIDPPCPACGRGDLGNCERLAFGHVEPGLQSGYCAETGGGWSTFMVAHESQLHAVPDSMGDEDAVVVEPAACAVHAALRAAIVDGDVVVVLGTGTLGLLTIAALRRCTPAGTIVAVAKYPVQRDWATSLGADVACGPDEMPRLVRRISGSMAYGNQLTGGADAVLDCVGSATTIQQSLAVVKPRGRVTLVGMPATVKLDLTTLWHRETQLAGAYAYGTERLADGSWRRTFDVAFELVAAERLGRLVSATYPLAEYPAAIEHAANAGRRGGVKVTFDLRGEKERDR